MKTEIDMATLPQPPMSVREQFDLTGRIVVVTGGGGFLGFHFAAAVAEMGAVPVLLDVDKESVQHATTALKDQGYECQGYTVDLTCRDSIGQTIRDVELRCGGVDVLVNAAAFAMKNMREGGDAFFDTFEDYDEGLWQVVLDVNLTGTFLLTQAVGRAMRKRGRGVVINIASDVAVISPDQRIYEPNPDIGYSGVPFNTPISYPVTKAGILSFTRFLATHWAPHGIRVNSFSPAGVYRNHDPAFVQQLAERIPLGRMAFPQEYKGPIVFLASDASSFMTGANLIVDGGRTIW